MRHYTSFGRILALWGEAKIFLILDEGALLLVELQQNVPRE